MNFRETKLKDAYLIEPERIEDDRGFFARAWCQQEFAEHGLNSKLVQCNLSFNHKAGTLRGMHYQLPPFAETKLVRCTQGAIFDVIIDVRPTSATFLQWIGVELTQENRLMLYVPQGFAHGFQTLVDGSEVFYQMSEVYAPGYARGLRWNDPAIAIRWPQTISVMATRDQQYADCKPDEFDLFLDNIVAQQ
ncbi:MAG: dTDP-4-dehydrorhamnose 3,5-epimerase [Chloroflexi bacterium]|nr:dTDP-4-dehydrorhamnose 3,5-epimerase [Chloroflexota bacterium]